MWQTYFFNSYYSPQSPFFYHLACFLLLYIYIYIYSFFIHFTCYIHYFYFILPWLLSILPFSNRSFINWSLIMANRKTWQKNKVRLQLEYFKGGVTGHNSGSYTLQTLFIDHILYSSCIEGENTFILKWLYRNGQRKITLLTKTKWSSKCDVRNWKTITFVKSLVATFWSWKGR